MQKSTLTYQPSTRLLSNTHTNTPIQQRVTWMKKDNGLFDVAKGGFDGAEVLKPVSNFLFIKLSEKYKRKNLALYRDD